MTDEQQPSETTSKRRSKKTNAERAPRQVGAWVAKTPDGSFTVWTSELQARRAAAKQAAVVFVPWGEPMGAESGDTSKPGVWIGTIDERSAPFQRELGALRFAVPDSDVQFLQNGGRVGQ